MDGVPGASQPEMAPGGTFTYDFIVPDAGLFLVSPSRDVGGAGGLRLVRRAAGRGPGRPRRRGRRPRARLERYRHGFFFQVLDPRGVPVRPLAWKDTVNVPHDESVRILVRFDERPGSWMFHCHILDHADGGLMGTVEVDSGATSHRIAALICICSSLIAVDSAHIVVRHSRRSLAPADHEPPHARDPLRGGGHHRARPPRRCGSTSSTRGTSRATRTRCAISFYNMRFEPHPRLWYLCLFALTRFTHNPAAMQALHGVIGTRVGRVARLLLAVPPPRRVAARVRLLHRVRILRDQPRLRARHPVRAWRVRGRRRAAPTIVVIAALLALLANTSLFGLIVASALVLALLPQCRGRRLVELAPAGAIVIAGVALSLWALMPSPESRFGRDWYVHASLNRLEDVSSLLGTAYVPASRLHEPSPWNSSLLVADGRYIPYAGHFTGAIVGVAILLLAIVHLRRQSEPCRGADRRHRCDPGADLRRVPPLAIGITVTCSCSCC